jgi:hypothetical protein
MPRPSITVAISSLLFAVFSLSACKTIYTDMYRPKRNYFKPEKATPKPAEVLLPSTPIESAPAAPAAAPGLDPVPAGVPGAPGEAAPAPAPAIPGL